MSEKSNTRYSCNYLNSALMVTPYSEVRPCCRFDTSLYDESFTWDGKNPLDDFYSKGIFKNIRKDLDNGIATKGCHRCYREEELGIPSMRQKSFPTDTKSNRYDDIQLTFIELSSGRICNLKCRSCNALFSTKWEAELSDPEQAHIKSLVNTNLDNISDDFFKQTRVLKITGGEPFLNPGFPNLISRLSKCGLAKQISLEVFTNVTTQPKPETLAALKDFESVTISMSIDATGAQNTYIRHPSSWKKTDELARFWIEQKKLNIISKVNVATTVTNYNILSLFDLIKWVETIAQKPAVEIIFQIAHDPKYLSVPLLPLKIRQNLLHEFEAQWLAVEKDITLNPLLITRLNKITKILKNNVVDEEPLGGFIDETRRMDQLRREQFSETFKTLAKIYDSNANF